MKTKLVAVLVEPSVHERLRVRAFEERCSVGEIIRRAVAEYLPRSEWQGERKRRKR